jgi:hypothetical protein
MHFPTIALSMEPHLICYTCSMFGLGMCYDPKSWSDYVLERRPPFLVANPVICINSFSGPPKYVWWASVIGPLELFFKKSSFAQSQNIYIVVSYFWTGYKSRT